MRLALAEAEVREQPAVCPHPCISFSQLIVGAEHLLDLTAGRGDDAKKRSWADQVLDLRSRAAEKRGGTYRFPLLGDDVVGWCRECDGPVVRGDPWAKNLVGGFKSAYGLKWRDEGMIAWKQSLWVCGGCRALRSSSDRGWAHPGAGNAVLVYPGVGMKLSLAEALEGIAAGVVGVPFTLLVGDSPQPNQKFKHLYRFVPLNWTLGERVDAYWTRVGDYSPMSFRLRPVLDFVAGWGGQAEKTYRRFAEASAGLLPSERRLAYLILFASSEK